MEQIITTEQKLETVFNLSVFEACEKVSKVLARTELIPESLRTGKDKKPLELSRIEANCFLVVAQAHRWGIDPMACIDCASVVHGRLMWEGKLVGAILEKNLGVTLKYDYSGEGQSRKVIVSGTRPGETEARTVEGTVAVWKTSQWTSQNYDQRLSYRGAREWARRHAPSVLFGVITNDEELPKNGPKSINDDAVVLSEKPKPFKLPSPEPVEPEPAEPEPVEQPKPKPAESESTEQFWGRITDVEFSESPPDAKKQWKRWRVTIENKHGVIQKATTFSTTLGGESEALKGCDIVATVKHEARGVKLVEIEEVPF